MCERPRALDFKHVPTRIAHFCGCEFLPSSELTTRRFGFNAEPNAFVDAVVIEPRFAHAVLDRHEVVHPALFQQRRYFLLYLSFGRHDLLQRSLSLSQ